MRQIILDFNLGSNSFVQSMSTEDVDVLPNAEFKIMNPEEFNISPGERKRVNLRISDQVISPAEDLFMQPSLRSSMIMAGYELSELMYIDGQWVVIIEGVNAFEEFTIDAGQILLTGRYVTRTNVRVL